MTRVSATLRVLKVATLRSFQCHLNTDWVSRGNSSYRHSLFFLLFYHIFLDSDTLPPRPIPYTTQRDHKPRHTTLQWNLHFQRSSSTDWPLGLWHRCLLDSRMFCCINFLCGCPATLPLCFF